MPFGQKNAGATYQWLMNKVFVDHIGQLMEVYMDDMLVKTQREETFLSDLAEVFGTIKKHEKRLNPTKCTFAVEAGKFLGFILIQRGIEANSDKCQVILNMKSPTCVKEYLADFVVEYTNALGAPVLWSLYVDDSSNKAGSGAGIILESGQGTQIELSLKFEFSTSNNQAEYEALLTGLKLAKEVGAQRLTIFSDSQIVTLQIDGSYQAKDTTMKKYLDRTKEQLESFGECEVRYIPREQNA
ncbi:uncharacterized protein LOC107636566 [Arachis ipaensis]|uniref:uncharacterized protein LOC107636566 n=1 Tax=Arachis ipaensis TaxID=130454 RepID=UPI0007AF1F5B|nr:uncharacterized protein LOC107636566 [Arachis ipaensis]XP_025647684.1 uncharacterized protein LOC112742660 [Arachis hypogaea]